MKHSFSLHFHGEIISGEEDAAEALDTKTEIIKESFLPNLQHGVTLTGMSINIDLIPERIQTSGVKG